jgi:cytidine deaminase
MKLLDLTKSDMELVEKARELIKKRFSKKSTVGAALRSKNNNIFSGVSIEIEFSSPCSICAEYAAIGTMVSEGDKEIDTIVAILLYENKFYILPPCGKCRQFISEFGNPYIIIEEKEKLKKTKLNEIHPFPQGF